MDDRSSSGDFANLKRFYGYVLPYWKIVIVAFAATIIYTAVSLNAVYLIKPTIEAIQVEEQAAGSQQESTGSAPAGDPAPDAAGEGAPPEPDTAPLAGAKQEAEQWFGNLTVVRKARQWLFPARNLRRIALTIFIVIGPLLLISGFVKTYAQGVVLWSVMADLRMDLFRKLSSLSLSYFAHQRTGELVSRLTNDLNNTRKALKIVFAKATQQPIMFVGALGLALYASWQLTLIAAVCFPFMALILGRFGYRIRRHSRKTLERLADVTDSITQVLSGIRVVKSFHMEEAENEDFHERNQSQLKRALRMVRNRAFADILPEFFMLLPLAGVALAAHYLLPRTDLTLGRMMLCLAALGFMASPVRRTVKAFNDLQQSLPGVTRMFEVLDTEPEITDDPNAVQIDGVHEAVEFDDVWFAYDTEPVLKGIDLRVPVGQVYAVVGETGAGKSTLLDLVPRFYDPTRGEVRVDGTSVRRIKRDSLMEQIAIVGQHPFLFNRPLAENIRYGKPDATDREVAEAARAANIHRFIEGLPDGYQTLAGEAGGRLSGGQRQCVTIARAILKNAPILILDEATSSLDAESEMQVQQALDRLMEGRTTFVIAHRLSTIRHADRIIVLRDGQIVEQGDHQELLRLEGEYSRLYQLQFFETE